MYYIFYILLFLFYFIFKNSYNEKLAIKKFVISITLVFSLFTALRHMAVGNDTYAYFMAFEKVGTSSFNEVWQEVVNSFSFTTDDSNKDPGYNILSKLMYNVCFGSFELYQYFIALLIFSAIGVIVYKSVNSLFGLIFGYGFYISYFYHYLPNSATRQSIALGLMLWAFIFWIKNKKMWFSIVLLVIAISVHKSSLVALLPIFLYYLPKKSALPAISIVCSLVVIAFAQQLAFILASSVESESYVGYAMSSYYQNTSKPYGYIILIATLFILGLVSRTLSFDSKDRLSIFTNINCCLGIVFAPLILANPSLIRVSSYFAIWYIPLIALTVRNASIKEKRIVVLLIFMLTIGWSCINNRGSGYYFCWENIQLHERYE